MKIRLITICAWLFSFTVASAEYRVALVISDGDIVECRINGFKPLVNPVLDLKNQKG